jgi:hypothetical protein
MHQFLWLLLAAGSWTGTEVFAPPVPGPDGSVRIEDCVNLVGEQTPPLPVRTVYIPVPPGARPELSYSVTRGASALAHDHSASFSAETAVLRGTAPLAGGFFAVVDLFPWTGGADYASSVDIRLTWADPPGTGAPVAALPGSPAAGISPGTGSFWPLPGTRAASPFHGRPWARLSVLETGPVEVTGAVLEEAGCPATGQSVSSLALYSGPGTAFGDLPEEEQQLLEIPILVDDRDGDGLFDPEDGVLFVAMGLTRWTPQDSNLVRITHRYATHRVYWLTWGGAPGLRMEQREAAPSGPVWEGENPWIVTCEEDLLWFPAHSFDTGWVWENLEGGGSLTIPYSLPGLETGTGSDFTVRLSLDQATHCSVKLYINGSLQGTEQVEGTGPGEAVFQNVPAPEGGAVRLDFASSGNVLFDRLDIRYRRIPRADGAEVFFAGAGGEAGTVVFREAGDEAAAFDISVPDAPVLLTGLEFQSGNLKAGVDLGNGTVLMAADPEDFSAPDSVAPASPGRLVGSILGGDKLVVAPEELLEGAWSVAALEEALGWSTVVATTREIYDEFGMGLTDPGAIRSAVRWAMDSWAPSCTEVILVGDGHYDLFLRTTSQPVMIPPWIRLNGTSEPPCVDDWYVMVHQGAYLPEIPIARLPVDSPLKLSAMVEKASLALAGESSGSWMNRCVLLADDEWGNGSYARESYHTEDFEVLEAGTIPGDVRRVKFYLVEYPWPQGTSPEGPHPEKPEAREDFIRLWNDGMGCLVFMGHGSAGQITHEKVFRLSDVSLLQNGGRLPLVILASCDLSAFDTPGSECIGEALVYSAGGGALSTVAATRKTFPGASANFGFTRVLLDSLYNSGTPAGMAVWYSKLANSSSYSSNNRYYVLFGLPGLPVPRPGPLPWIQVQGDTLRTGERNSVTGAAGFPSGLALLEILESGRDIVYNMLGGGTIEYTALGGTAWRGAAVLSGGDFSAECFIPYQARPGGKARTGATGVAFSQSEAGAVDPMAMVEGSPESGDETGPEIEMWIQGHRGAENPVITGESVFTAELADSSGICILGGEGSRLRLFVDGVENDLGPYFSYITGSTTRGRVSYDLPELSQGQHLLILQAVDGLGNPSADSLALTSAPAGETVFSMVAVYPNPGSGDRCFSFHLSGDAWVEVGIFTVAGREIARLTGQCRAGYNQILWNGLDADGDPPATGAYIFRLSAEAAAGGGFIREADHTGVLAVVNQGGAP